VADPCPTHANTPAHLQCHRNFATDVSVLALRAPAMRPLGRYLGRLSRWREGQRQARRAPVSPYYAGFVLDPDGNNVEVVFHGPAKRSAEKIDITF
jgi:hypothetical protein